MEHNKFKFKYKNKNKNYLSEYNIDSKYFSKVTNILKNIEILNRNTE